MLIIGKAVKEGYRGARSDQTRASPVTTVLNVATLDHNRAFLRMRELLKFHAESSTKVKGIRDGLTFAQFVCFVQNDRPSKIISEFSRRCF